MENPDHEIRHVVRSLCQGTADEQRRTLDRYFTSDASFVHPFCTVPHFRERPVPILGRFGSRDVVRGIFQWYRMLSPRIDIEIDSALHDKARDKMYLDIRQVFSIWFVPMYHAYVRLVTVLDLVATDDANYHEPLDRLIRHDEEEHEDGEKAATAHRHGYVPSSHHAHRRWKIARQEDLYQANDVLRFVAPLPLPFLWFLFQLGASALCVLMALFVRLSPWAFQRDPARGGVEAVIEYRDDAASAAPATATAHADKEEEEEEKKSRERKDGGDSSITGSTYQHYHHEDSVSGEDGRESGSGGVATNGHHHRGESANSKASSSNQPKKSSKSGGGKRR